MDGGEIESSSHIMYGGMGGVSCVMLGKRCEYVFSFMHIFVANGLEMEGFWEGRMDAIPC
jgi:hypothetical protein